MQTNSRDSSQLQFCHFTTRNIESHRLTDLCQRTVTLLALYSRSRAVFITSLLGLSGRDDATFLLSTLRPSFSRNTRAQVRVRLSILFTVSSASPLDCYEHFGLSFTTASSLRSTSISSTGTRAADSLSPLNNTSQTTSVKMYSHTIDRMRLCGFLTYLTVSLHSMGSLKQHQYSGRFPIHASYGNCAILDHQRLRWITCWTSVGVFRTSSHARIAPLAQHCTHDFVLVFLFVCGEDRSSSLSRLPRLLDLNFTSVHLHPWARLLLTCWEKAG